MKCIRQNTSIGRVIVRDKVRVKVMLSVLVNAVTDAESVSAANFFFAFLFHTLHIVSFTFCN